jgi:hypothetical protein
MLLGFRRSARSDRNRPQAPTVANRHHSSRQFEGTSIYKLQAFTNEISHSKQENRKHCRKYIDRILWGNFNAARQQVAVATTKQSAAFQVDQAPVLIPTWSSTQPTNI